MAMTNEQLDSIGAFLKTNPSQEALSAAMQQYGVGAGDLDAARARMAPPAQTYAQQQAAEYQKGLDSSAALQKLRQATGQENTPFFSGTASMTSGANSAAYLPAMYEQYGISVPEAAKDDYRKATGQAWQAGTKAPTAFNPQSGQYTIAPAPAAPTTAPTPAAPPKPNLGMGGGPSAPDVQYTRPYMQSPGNGAAVMPPETTGQRGMQQYNPAGMPGGGEMSRPGGGGVMIQNPDGSERPYGTPAPGGGYNPGMGAQGPNPYLNQMASGMAGQVQQNFLQQTMPQLRSGAQASGQYGGSRQGIAEGVAAGNAATGLAGQLANLYGGAYNTDQANQTQRYGTNVGAGVSMRGQDVSQNIAGMNNQTTQMGQAQQYGLGLGQLGLGFQNAANNYNLGLGQLDLSNQGQNQNFYTSQRGQDLQQYQLGANLYGNGVNGQIGVGQGQYNVGQQYQNAPINAINQYGQAISPYTGYGQTQTTSGQAGGGANGVIGGGLAGAQIANNLWRGSQGNTAGNNGSGVNRTQDY